MYDVYYCYSGQHTKHIIQLYRYMHVRHTGRHAEISHNTGYKSGIA